jgi:hypothetical protein
MPSERPTGVSIVAWLWIGNGALMLFSGVMGGFAYFMMQRMTPDFVLPHAPPGMSLMTFVFEHFGALLVVQFMVAILAILAGIHLLRLRPWARTAIEILSWLGMIYLVVFGISWIQGMAGVAEHVPAGAASPSAEMLQLLGTVIGVVMTAIFAVPLAIMIWYLRKPGVRAAIRDATV